MGKITDVASKKIRIVDDLQATSERGAQGIRIGRCSS